MRSHLIYDDLSRLTSINWKQRDGEIKELAFLGRCETTECSAVEAVL